VSESSVLEVPPLGILGDIFWEAAKVAVIRAAIELRVIPIVGAGHRDAEDVAELAGCSRAGIRVLLDALCHLGVFCWADGGYSLSAMSREYLDPDGPVDYGEALLATDIRAFDRFTENVRTGHIDADVANPGAASIWAAAARADLARWADSAHLFRERWTSLGVTPTSMPGVRVLDAGCGAAVASLTIALDDPTAWITCLDREVVVEVARRTGEAMGVTGQASFVPGDVMTLAALDGPFDLAYFGDVFHFLDPATIGRVLRETRRLLTAGGRVVLHEPMRSPGDFTDVYAYLGAVWLFNAASCGGIYTYDQLASMLGEAGFVSPERLGDTQWVHARRAS
jgi:SAM-dependent methyltransferase